MSNRLFQQTQRGDISLLALFFLSAVLPLGFFLFLHNYYEQERRQLGLLQVVLRPNFTAELRPYTLKIFNHWTSFGERLDYGAGAYSGIPASSAQCLVHPELTSCRPQTKLVQP